MKATLKHIDNQYILIVDERPVYGKDLHYYDFFINEIWPNEDSWSDDACWKIIAAENLEGVKGIKIDLKSLMSISYEEFVSLINTEVEVTEEEEYYIVRL